MKKENKLTQLRIPLMICSLFWAIGIVLWQTREKVFYLFNFGFIGSAAGLGNPLGSGQDHRTDAFRKGMVRVGVLDRHGF